MRGSRKPARQMLEQRFLLGTRQGVHGGFDFCKRTHGSESSTISKALARRAAALSSFKMSGGQFQIQIWQNLDDTHNRAQTFAKWKKCLAVRRADAKHPATDSSHWDCVPEGSPSRARLEIQMNHRHVHSYRSSPCHPLFL
jgi:hypothetical protein